MTVLLGTGGGNVDVSLVEGVRVCLVDILAFDRMHEACGAGCDEGSMMMFLGPLSFNKCFTVEETVCFCYIRLCELYFCCYKQIACIG